MQMKFSDGQSKFSRVFNFAILGYPRNSRKLDARKKISVLQYFLYGYSTFTLKQWYKKLQERKMSSSPKWSLESTPHHETEKITELTATSNVFRDHRLANITQTTNTYPWHTCSSNLYKIFAGNFLRQIVLVSRIDLRSIRCEKLVKKTYTRKCVISTSFLGKSNCTSILSVRQRY